MQAVIELTANPVSRLLVRAWRRAALRAAPRPTVPAVHKEALAQSEARFRALAALSAEWYWEQDEQFRFVWQAGEELRSGHARPQGYIGFTRWEAHPDSLSAEQWAAHRAQLEAHESFYNLEYARQSVDGETRWVSVSGSPIFDEAGVFRGYRGVGRDITERKRAEELLRLEHGVTRCLAASGGVPETLRCILRSVCETVRWQCGIYWAVDRSSDRLRFAESWAASDPATERFIADSRPLGYASGEGLVGLARQFAEPLWTLDAQNDPRAGATRPLPAHKGAILFPVLAEGEVLGVMSFSMRALRKPDERLLQTLRVIGSQIGQYLRRKAGEQALTESEARFRGLTALSSDWYWEQDAEFRFTCLSDAFGQVSGLDASMFVGRQRWDLPALNLGPDDWAAHRAVLERHEPFRDFEVLRRRPDGSKVWKSISGAPVFDEAGRFCGYRGVTRDITAKKRRNEMLDLEQAVMRRLAAATRPDEGLREALRTVCEAERWGCGTLWRLDAGSGKIRVAEQCLVSGVAEIGELAAAAHALAYAPGEGPVGRAWRSGEPVCEADAVLVPLTVGGGVAGVLEFNCRQAPVPDAPVLRALAAIAAHVAGFLQRADADVSLRQSEARFRSLSELSSDWFWQTDAEHRFLDTPERVNGMTGFDATAYVGKARWEIPGLAPLSGDWKAHRATLARRESFRDLALVQVNADGSRVYFQVSGAPVFGPGGEFLGYHGVGRDISAQREAGDRLRLEHSVVALLASAEKVSDGLRGAIRAVCESEGWDCGRYFTVDARKGLLRYGDGWGVADPAVTRFLAKSHGLMMRRGEGLAGEVWESGWPLWVPDVSADPRVYARALLREYGTHAALLLPVRGGPRVVGILAFSFRSDREPDARLAKALGVIASQLGQFLQRKAAEQALRESEQRFRSLSELSSDYYWEQDEEHRFVKLLGAGLQAPGFPEDDALGKTHWELDCPNMSAGDWDRHRADLEARREFRDLTLARPGSDGELRYYNISGQPVFDASGRFRGYRGVAKDITDRMRAEEMVRRTNDCLEQIVRERTAQLEHANRELESYNYSISHDLRQPLSAIAGFADLLSEHVDPRMGALVATCAREIQDNAARMDQIIESLRRLADSSSGALCVARVEVAGLIEDVVHELWSAGPLAADIRVGELPTVEADPALLRQVWSNLIGNALKYSRDNPAPLIEIGGERLDDGSVRYTIRDNGVGFDMRDADRLFTTFQRLATAAGFEGHGIGLAIVQRIVRRHGGTISAEGAPGKGAAFHLTLPDRRLA